MTHPISRRSALGATLALTGLCLNAPAAAQGGTDFPTKPVTVFTAFAVGSGPDAVLRLVANRLSIQWKQSVTVDNRPGGGGFIAIEAARRAAADGYSLVQLDSEHLAALPYLYKSRNFTPSRPLTQWHRCFARRSWWPCPPSHPGRT